MIAPETAAKVLAAALRTGGDFADLYVEDASVLRLGMDESKLEQATRGSDRGAGVRVLFGSLATYAYTDDLSEESLLNAARAAAAAGASGGANGTRKIDLTRRESALDYPLEKAFDSLPLTGKAALLHQIDAAARAYDPRVQQVEAGYAETRRHVWMFTSDGAAVEDDRSFIEIGAQVVAVQGDIRQTAGRGFGGRVGLELLDANDPAALARELAESAVRMLDARPAPAGEMMVVVCNGWGGVLFHEACGHAMEADFINNGSSAYAGKVGERVANPLITYVDDGTIPGRRGSLRFDDDATPAQRTILVENGIQRDYMYDLVEARRAGRPSTGNGRRESFRHLPMPRMTNTFITAGPHDPDEIIASVKYGLYVKSMAGGQAELAKGDFVFNATEAYLIEDGRLTAPVRGASIIGNGPAVLAEIDMVGSDFALDPGMGTCGKGQAAKVSVGQPTVRIPRVMVGGTMQAD
jgi:TldD protein